MAAIKNLPGEGKGGGTCQLILTEREIELFAAA